MRHNNTLIPCSRWLTPARMLPNLLMQVDGIVLANGCVAIVEATTGGSASSLVVELATHDQVVLAKLAWCAGVRPAYAVPAPCLGSREQTA